MKHKSMHTQQMLSGWKNGWVVKTVCDTNNLNRFQCNANESVNHWLTLSRLQWWQKKNNEDKRRWAKPISRDLSLPTQFAHAKCLLGKEKVWWWWSDLNQWAHLWSQWLQWTRSWCLPCGCPPLGCTYTGKLLQNGWDNSKIHLTGQRSPCHPTCPFWMRGRHCRETGREGSPQVHPMGK